MSARDSKSFRARSVCLALLRDNVEIAEGIWVHEYSLQDSLAAREREAKVLLATAYRWMAYLNSFDLYYRETIGRVRSTYDKVSRLITVQQSIMGMTPLANRPDPWTPPQ